MIDGIDEGLIKRMRALEEEVKGLKRMPLPVGHVFNVRNYGALGTYADDVSVAVDAIVDSNSFGTIYFPCINGERTVYRFQSAVTIPRTFEIEVDSGAILWIDHASALIKAQQPLHAEWFGADSQAAATGTGCSISTGSDQLTVDSASTFRVGNGILVPGAGAAGADLFARIKAISGTTFTLDETAGTTVSSVRCLGDDSIPIQTIIDNCQSTDTTISHELVIVPGITQICQSIVLKSSCRLRGSQRFWDKIIGIFAGSLIKLNASINVELDHILVGGGGGITFLDSNGYAFIDGSIHDCWFAGSGGGTNNGLDCFFSTTTIYNCVFESMTNAIIMRANTGYVNVSDCLFSGILNTCFYMVGSSGNLIRDVNINNITCPVWTPTGALPCFVRAEYCQNINVSNISIRKQADGTGNSFYQVFRLVTCERINISNVTMLNAGRTGAAAFFAQAAYYVSVFGFSLLSESTYEPAVGFEIVACRDFHVVDFYIEGTESEGIVMSSTNVNVSFTNGRITKTGTDDNSKASIKPVGSLIKLSNLYLFSSSSYSDYAIDPSALPNPSYFTLERSSIDGYPSGLWDVSTIPASISPIVRDLDIGGGEGTFTANDATPSVAYGKDVYKTANSSATTITMFDNGYIGQVIKVVINDANTTVDFSGTNLIGNSGSDWTPDSGDAMICFFNGTNWYCSLIQD